MRSFPKSEKITPCGVIGVISVWKRGLYMFHVKIALQTGVVEFERYVRLPGWGGPKKQAIELHYGNCMIPCFFELNED